MNLKWGDPHLSQFVTTIGLITSYGKNGHNIMACEWTHVISYSPALIALAIRDYKATYENTVETKEFGVSLAAEDQNVVASIAGKSSGHEIDKIAVLKVLGVHFVQGSKTGVQLVEGTSVSAECTLVKTVEIGDHPLLIGEIVAIQSTDKKPLLYHQTKYFSLGDQIHKPNSQALDHISSLLARYSK